MNSELDFTAFMVGLVNAPISDSHDSCADCRGLGWKPLECCSGYHCGCHGLPYDFEVCGCGISPASDAQIAQWAKPISV